MITTIAKMSTEITTGSTCTCSETGYSPDCPQAFYQNGTILHSISGETKLKPKQYQKSLVSESVHPEDPPSSIHAQAKRQGNLPMTRQELFEIHCNPREIANLQDYQVTDDQYIQVEKYMEHQAKQLQPQRAMLGRGQMGDDISMIEERREILRRFEPLKIGETTLTAMSIGGFQVDLSKAAQKAKEIAPLPPSKLPIIFRDDEMNFWHHFFQGLERLIGRDILLGIIESTHYFDGSDEVILPLIEGMIKVGYERTDNETTIFTKKVLTSTFEIDDGNDHNPHGKILIVAANMWGFQYIECGMQCKEAELRMWLSICYNHYRTVWFNTFKSAGIPSFALEGVQARYEPPRPDQFRTSSHPEDAIMFRSNHLSEGRLKEHDSRSKMERRHRSSKKSRSPESTIESMFKRSK